MDRSVLWICAVCTSVALAPSAGAQTPEPAAPSDVAASVEMTAETMLPVAPREIGEAEDMLADEALAELRGGAQIVVANQSLSAITAGNVINGDYLAGTVSLSDNALSNFTGIGNLLINTGAQVSLQTGVNITLNINQ